MFLLALLASQAFAEWVEIAQNHYRKEPFRKVVLDFEETTRANRIYTNYSVTQRSRNKDAITRFPNIGNIERIQLPSKKKLENPIYGDIPGKEIPSTQHEKFTSLRLSKIAEEMRDTDSKFQEIKVTGYHKHKTINIDPTVIQINHDLGRGQRVTDTSSLNIKQVIRSPNDDVKNYFEENNKKGSGKIDKVHNEKHTKKTLIVLESNSRRESSVQPSNVGNLENYHNVTVPESVGKLKVKEINLSDAQMKLPGTKKVLLDNSQKIYKINDGKYGTNAAHDEEDFVNNTSTAKVIWKFMKVITDNISRNTHRSFRSKLRYLESLRNNILANIEARIEQAWPEDDAARNDGEGTGPRRNRRAAPDAARGHVEFPSSEGALMTISFLTFAVFLIKLVLQVIHTYKNKTMMVSPAVVAAVGRAAAAFKQEAHKLN